MILYHNEVTLRQSIIKDLINDNRKPTAPKQIIFFQVINRIYLGY